ncbi:hypothetical protein L484_020919 [Morus notabilis]|uniref:Uncharacterized protein n=1 Tax=Morus notabilis TaxID=981085 RepID=W9QE47_9ROSA|nr:hypothetical protein L484_020919 [Morus notabilis]
MTEATTTVREKYPGFTMYNLRWGIGKRVAEADNDGEREQRVAEAENDSERMQTMTVRERR